MGRPRQAEHERLLDAVEDRIRVAPAGMHRLGPSADPAAVEASGLDPEVAAAWERFDGIDMAQNEARIYTLEEIESQTRECIELGTCRPGDRVIGEAGLALLALAADPYEEGAEVVLLEEDGERAPFASSVPRLLLLLLGDMQVLFEDDGEYREGLFSEEDGELRPDVERKLCRKRLDSDDDAPLPRFRLAQLLRRSGELRGAKAELRQTIKRAPEWVWPHFELGRTCAALDDMVEARRAFARAVETAADEGLRAACLAWSARVAEDEPARVRAAAEVETLYPGFCAAQEAGAREALEAGEPDRALELLELGLAVQPRHIGLLDVQRALRAST